jgi:hypothetical protein
MSGTNYRWGFNPFVIERFFVKEKSLLKKE